MVLAQPLLVISELAHQEYWDFQGPRQEASCIYVHVCRDGLWGSLDIQSIQGLM